MSDDDEEAVVEDVDELEKLMDLTAQYSDGVRPWFVGRREEILVYKINRRPEISLSIFEAPDDLFEHQRECLEAAPKEVRSGRRIQREWHIGNLKLDPAARTIVGRIGWSRKSTAAIDGWNEESLSFSDDMEERTDSAVVPFAIIIEEEYVGILKHPTFQTESVPGAVFFGKVPERG